MVEAGLGLLAGWSTVSAEWLTRVDDQAFPQVVEDALLRLVSFDSTVAFSYAAARPSLLHDGLKDIRSSESMTAYLNGTYLLDPFYLACASSVPCGLYRMSEIAPDLYKESEYFNSPQVHPCISMQSGSLAEEIAFLFRLNDGAMAAYSLMRVKRSGAFASHDVAVLRAVEPFVRVALQHHWRHLRVATGEVDVATTSASQPDVLEDQFAGFAKDRLTQQQQRIIQLLLRGHSSGSVGRLLGITEGTVKNHRHAIYERLGIGTQSELFSLFVRHLVDRRRARHGVEQ